MKLGTATIAVTIAGLLLGASPARADGFVAPSIGVNFGGNAGDTLVDAAHDSSKVSVGVAAGWMFSGVIGFEEDFSYGPNFFGDGGGVNSSRVVTLMSNVIVGIPVGGQRGGGIRPYASAGLGLINRNVETPLALANFSSNDFGYDLGAGVMGYFSDHVGVRAGVQYFRNFDRTNDNVVGLEAGHFNFFRGAFGVLVRF